VNELVPDLTAETVAADLRAKELQQYQLRSIVATDMLVESVEAPREPEKEGELVLRGRLLRPSHEVFTRWLTAYNAIGYTPMLRHIDEEGDPNEVLVRLFRGVAAPGKPRVWINAVLFALTLVSTLFVGSLYGDNGLVIESAWDLLRPENLIKGLPFAATLLGILAAHEFGHYFAARYHKVAVTLPYFIPMPLTFGTLGAFIQLKEPVPDRRKLFDIGVAGPLAGLAVALPLLVVGLMTSPLGTIEPAAGAMIEGNSIVYYLGKWLAFGQPLPNWATGQDVFMNQVLYAAWIGLLVTALNLLPVGQLDGGHTVYALFGKNARYANLATLGIMGLFALAGLPFVQELIPAAAAVGYTGWFIWLFLIMAVIGVEHPPALDDVTRLDRRRRWVGYAVIVIFILTFVPVPMRPL
jgi:membrane-associated protease RseP (regulator of RpoE activity)